jgi:L-gulonate 3-dehydrogenase
MSADKTIAVVGAGLVGRDWTIVFARAGLPVRVFDQSAATLDALTGRLRQSLTDLESYGLIEGAEKILARVEVASSLAEAVEGAEYVQESVLERTDTKRALYAELDGLLGDGTIVGSSSSGIPASEFTEGLGIAPRCLVAHPVNPPYLAPVVELVPSPWTRSETVDRVHALMTEVGQHPVRVAREVRGFVLNRLQGALLREAWALFDEGYCSIADLDATISKGLGLRWSFMGPFETIDLNAPDGIADYAHRLGELYRAIEAERGGPAVPWSDQLIDRAEAERRAILPAAELGARGELRDRRLMALAAHQRAMARQEGD